MNIRLFEEQYRDDLVFMVLQAKDALGRKPRIYDDLHAIKSNCFDHGDEFWVAVDTGKRVIGCIGYSRIGESDEAFLHRLYVKVSNKHTGIGTKLLAVAEASMKANGINIVRAHLGEPKEQWFESYSFYPKNGYIEYAPRYMMKRL